MIDHLRGNELWLPDYFRERTITLALSHNSEERVKVSREAIEGDKNRLIIPRSIQTHLRGVSQLGLKEVWLKKAPAQHNRWDHSVGTYNVGFIWLSVLEADQRVPQRCLMAPLENWRKIKEVVGTALLLHDYGHLPFAHLFSEVLESINWLPKSVESSENAVLFERLGDKQLEFPAAFAELITREKLNEGALITKDSDVRDLVGALILGSYGIPWLQAIVNSPIDADKIDYLRYDSQLLDKSDYSVRPRLLTSNPSQWLTEFLYDQEVNHAGLLALHGHSARATAELWKERIHLYDRFYLSPELRIPERIAFEILQQYLIHCTMSSPFFERQVLSGALSFATEAAQKPHDAIDPIEAKYRSVVSISKALGNRVSGERLEFELLRDMYDGLESQNGIDREVQDFLKACFEVLERLQNTESPESVSTLMAKSLVREPLLVPRESFTKVRDLLRPLQHAYCREALIDIARMPRVLAAPGRYRTSFQAQSSSDTDYQILVPSGPVSGWGPGQQACCPLSDETVAELEKPYSFCRLIVICPDNASSPQANYVWDRVRSRLLEEDINVQLAGERRT